MTEKRGAGAAVTVLGQESQAVEIESMLRAAPEEEEKAARSDFSLWGKESGGAHIIFHRVL